MDLPVNEIEFSSDTAHRKQWFRGCSFSHPAKMHLSLQMYLIEHYTKPGDTILDCMAGSGTLLVACAIGRNIICVELEKKFVDMQQANWEKIKALGPILGYTMGQAQIIQGDARNLEGLLADSCIFSPPYAEMITRKPSDKDVDNEAMQIGGKLFNYNPDNLNNISNLPYGEISAVISSPPYEGTISGKELDDSEKLVERKSGKEKWGKHLRLGQSQLSKYADVICTSPPYEEQIKRSEDCFGANLARMTPKQQESWQRKMSRSLKQKMDEGYSKNQGNIGNLKSDSYLEAMLLVYQSCFRILKLEGLLILVTKNFIRDKKIVRLDSDTIKLCEQAGFTLTERLKRKLTQQSFWRRIYMQKYPDAPKIDFEDVLVFQK